MGHTSTAMIYKTNARYIPNLVRNDGSAFDREIVNNLKAIGGKKYTRLSFDFFSIQGVPKFG
ncbi:MAG: hypothetical protein GY874_10800 [Desulfobacteraceae bacterium]|nr:hypothetical protein [Desulfobacteraceae bacterium]